MTIVSITYCFGSRMDHGTISNHHSYHMVGLIQARTNNTFIKLNTNFYTIAVYMHKCGNLLLQGNGIQLLTYTCMKDSS